MREIKFRLIEENKVVGYEKWYPGTINKETGLYTAFPKWLYSEDGKYWNPQLITHRFKNEFTALHDKNGKEIYEGDLIRITQNESSDIFDNRIEKINAIAKVYFKDGAFQTNFYNSLLRIALPGNWIVEVIGNIHEHPELIN